MALRQKCQSFQSGTKKTIFFLSEVIFSGAFEWKVSSKTITNIFKWPVANIQWLPAGSD